MKLESYQLFFKNITASAKFGFLEAEQKLFQRIYIDLRFTLQISHRVIKDDLSTVYDYSKVLESVKTVLEQRPYRLLEDLSNTLASAFLADKDISKIQITIKKPAVPLDGILDYVSTQMMYLNE